MFEMCVKIEFCFEYGYGPIEKKCSLGIKYNFEFYFFGLY